MAALMFIPREILLVEIDRRCFFPDCNARTLVGLTKQEARDYRGFECALCKRWNDDNLSDKDVPDEWHAIVRPIN
ncbi:MAG: hypothetical protein H0V18_04950 [Pyrinomonadaceae bacterium]|nr:hypothetical protein [Pyrinomonadaceae bacterium]